MIMISPELLKRHPIFGSLSDEQLQPLASIAEEQNWEAWETIFGIVLPAENL